MQWIPLESNPSVLNNYGTLMGLNPNFAFSDVLSTEDWALEMIPQPCVAVLLLYKITPTSESFNKEEEERIQKEGQVASSEKIYFMKQNIGNACGTIGLLHAVGNASISNSELVLKDTFLDRFLEKTKGKLPTEIATILENEKEIETFHTVAATDKENQTTATDEDVDNHFITFCEVEGNLYEFDGRKSAPICHGPCPSNEVLQNSIKAIQKFISRDPEGNFAILALAGASVDE
eukprot:c22245_g1_i1.p1 GENE.c22245_g1_i1~~c22245_g1_i1.p1  ORF type:complete len:241 (-),score=103.56 c22245_g1_i1:205-906(-)